MGNDSDSGNRGTGSEFSDHDEIRRQNGGRQNRGGQGGAFLGADPEDSLTDDSLSDDPLTVIDLDTPSADTLGATAIGSGSIEGGDEDFEGDGARGGLVAARGTVDGLVIRVDGRLESGAMRQALDEFVSARSSFLAGQEVFLEWVGVRPEVAVEESLTQLLTKSYGIIVKSVRLFSRPVGGGVRSSLHRDAGVISSAKGSSVEGAGSSSAMGLSPSASARRGGESLFGGVRSIESEHTRSGASTGGALLPRGPLDNAGRVRSFQSPLSGNVVPWDEPDSRLVHATLRSGQRLESEHSLVIVGDVNSGAEVVSGGDIVILGTLRGVAHAGAYEESGGGRVIFSLNMQPTQLRIGAVISRGGAADGRGADRVQDGRVCPEVARVDGTLIVVEPYQTKTLGGSVGRAASGLASTVGLLGRRRGAA